MLVTLSPDITNYNDILAEYDSELNELTHKSKWPFDEEERHSDSGKN